MYTFCGGRRPLCSVYSALFVPESGFRGALGFGVSSFGDGKKTLKLSRVIFSEIVTQTLFSVEL